MNRKKYLLNNFILLFLGNISIKLINILLVPLYSRQLTPEQFGICDLLMNTASILVPFLSFGISEGVFRFALDEKEDKKTIYTCSQVFVIFSVVMCLVIIPLFNNIPIFSDYLLLFVIYLICNIVYGVNIVFVRAIEKVKLFSIISFITVLLNFLFNYIFLVKLNLNIEGYFLAFIVSNCLGIVLTSILAKVHRYIDINRLNKKKVKELLVFSLPTVPNSLNWWIAGVSDRYIIAFFLGTAANGIYSMACKLPSIMNILVSVFNQAWQMSAIKERNSRDLEIVYSRMINSLISFSIISISFFIVFLKPIIATVLSNNYSEVYTYVPLLLLANLFSCLSSFLGVTYTVEKKNLLSTISTTVAAIFNILGNIIFVPMFGILGAIISTLISYVLLFSFRYITVKKIINFKLNKHMPMLMILLFISVISATMDIAYFSIIVVSLITIVIIIIDRRFLINCFGIILGFIKKRFPHQEAQ